MIATQASTLADQLIGQFRTFGSFGPAYQVLAVSRRNGQEKHSVRIRVLTSGEEVDYPVEQALEDPEAR